MMKCLHSNFISLVVAFVAVVSARCSEKSEFSGGAPAHEAQRSGDVRPQPQPSPPPVVQPSPQPTVQPTPEPNYDSYEGIITVNECGACLTKAVELSKGVGFTASKLNTFNLGAYKVPKYSNICDIHFMADMSYRIADHDGQDSVIRTPGKEQVILYCPCDCGWPNNKPPSFY